jgi:hypothetical protein
MQKLFAFIVVFVTLLGFSWKPAFAQSTTDTCTNKFPITQNGAQENFLYCSNKDINTADETVKRLIIVVHGTNRTASNYFASMSTAAKDANSTDSLIIAPHFTIAGDVSETDVPIWTNEGWKGGDNSSTTSKISSYTVIDNFISTIIDGKKFPNLKRIVVAGHSAGGQFTHRYASGTQIDQKAKEAGIGMRFVVANPSSYLYFTPERPVNGSTTQFAAPSDTSCSGYDTYKYGFNNMTPYMTAVGAAKIKDQFKDKNIVYLLGDQDTDPNDSDLDKSCEGETQGAFRFQRGNAYYGYLGHIYGQDVYKNQIKAPVPGVAHDDNAMFDSPVGRKYIFEDFALPSASGSATTGSDTTSSGSATSTGTDTSSSSGTTNVVPSAVCAGSTNNVCPSAAPTDSTPSSAPQPSSTTGSTINNTSGLSGNNNIILILITLLLRLFSGF